MRGRYSAATDHSKRLHKSAELVGYKCPVPVDELDRIKLEVMEQERAGGLLHPRVLLARFRDDGRQRPAGLDPHVRRRLVLGQLLCRQDQGHPRDHVRLAAPGAGYDSVGGQGGRAST
jgi:hypothetical protein